MENLTSLEPKSQSVEPRDGKLERGKSTPAIPSAWLPSDEKFKFTEKVEEKFNSLKKEVKKLESFIKKFKEAADAHRLCNLLYRETSHLHNLCTDAREQGVNINIRDACEIVNSATTAYDEISVTNLIDWLKEIDNAIHSLTGEKNHRPIRSLTNAQIQYYESAYDFVGRHTPLIGLNIEQEQPCSIEINQIAIHAKRMAFCWSHICHDLYFYIEKELEIIGNNSQDILEELLHKNRG